MTDRRASPEHWGVLGGGMLGLVIALRLAQAKRRVTLLESAPELGGLASAWRLGDGVWDRFYHVTLLSDTALRDLLRELGVEGEMQWRRTRTRLFDGQRHHPLDDVLDYAKLPVLGIVEKLRLAATIQYASRLEQGLALERIPVRDWLVRLSGRGTWEKLWQPLLRSKLGSNSDRVSAAFVWSVIRRFYAARRGGMRTEMFGYLSGGYARILALLAERLTHSGVRIQTSARVDEVRGENGGIAVRCQGQVLRFSDCVLTFASPLVAALCPDIPEQRRGLLAAMPHQGVICASLLSRRPLAGAYMTYLTGDAYPFTTVIDMSSLVGTEVTGGHHLIYLPRYLPSDSTDFDLDDDAIRREFLPGLQRLYPGLRDEDIVAFQVARSRYVTPLPVLDYSARYLPMESGVSGLHIVNSALIRNAASSVDETVRLAGNAVRDLLQRSQRAAAEAA